jgi:two-component system LytT family sensor kinase
MNKKTTDRIIKVVLHLLVWAFILGLPLYSARRLEVENKFLLAYYAFSLVNGLIFYINYLVLVPKLFFRKKKLRYYLSALVLLVSFYFVSDLVSGLVFSDIDEVKTSENYVNPLPQDSTQPGPPPEGFMRRGFFSPNAHFMGYFSSSLFILFLSLGIRVLERQSQIEKLQEEMEKTKLNTELAFLKNQISPHFFFNTLNNIYSLIGINAEDSQKAVLRLSKMMRYLLYESERGDTELSSEIEFMNNYIDLMKLRMTDKIELKISFPEKCDEICVPPLLFIPFIENAFKHGMSSREKSFIDISMRTGLDNITFRCANSLFLKKEETEPGHSGIGLENSKTNNIFEVLLFINFA